MSFAVAVAVIVAFLGVMVDVGIAFGQRRFGQNGADAAALAVGRLLAGSLTPHPNGGLYFTRTDAEAYREALRYAGLDTTAAVPLAIGTPSGPNQNTGLSSRTQLAVTLEYWDGSRWCSSPAAVDRAGQPVVPPRQPAVPVCAYTIGGVYHPPLPSATQPYRVRVTVSATTNGFFAGVIGTGTPPSPPSDPARVACVRPAGAQGTTTCAHATVALRGSTTPTAANVAAPLIPVTTGACQLAPSSIGSLVVLWGPAAGTCGFDLGSWQNLLDLTAESRWCDDSNPDYRYSRLLPAGAWVAGGCAAGSVDSSWNRSGYSPDPRYAGNNDAAVDVAYWIARGFGGTVRVDSPGTRDGNWFPTYCNLRGGGGCANLGQNVAAGFYCGSGTTSSTCPVNVNAAGTYFFAKFNPDGTPRQGYHDVCPDAYGRQYGVGCRDAGVLVWASGGGGDGPQWAMAPQAGGTAWLTGGSGAPDRLRVTGIYVFRIYCDHDGNGLCTRPPRSIIGNAANSTVSGLFMSAFIPGPCPTCTTGPALAGTTASLES